MDKEFVPYQEALELKALGFDEPCFAVYDYRNKGEKRLFLLTEIIQEEDSFLEPIHIRNSSIGDDISAPTFSQAFRWFREKYGLASQFNYYHVPKWTYSILEFTNIKITPNQIVLEYSKERTYEEVELECLRKLIEIVKNK